MSAARTGAAHRRAAPENVYHVEQVMGMPVSIDIRDAPSGTGRDLVGDVVRWFHEVDATWSTYKDDSLITRFARGRLRPDQLPPAMHEVLDACERMEALSEGAFSIHIPAPNGTLLETSGYVKGWSVQRAADRLADHGVGRALINAGGDIAALGGPEPGRPWRVGIRHPRRVHGLADVVALDGVRAVATSGAYERGSHICDPRTGRPAATLLSATVIGDDLAVADAAATALFVMGVDGLDWLTEQGLDGMVITREDEMVMTSGYRRLRTVPAPAA